MSKESKISQATERKAGDYLFSSQGMDDSQFMDFRTRINRSETFNAIIYYSIVRENLGSSVAGNIKDAIERCLVSNAGKGREEATAVLRQQFPKVRFIETGHEKETTETKENE